MFRTRSRKTYADRMSIATGIVGEKWEGVTICEANRATVFEFRADGIRQLLDYCQNNYTLKGVRACVFGLDDGKEIKYAVYCRNGFLRSVPEIEDFTLRRRKNGNRTK